ncbi:MAG: type II secretion system F family protein [Verrucomicrobiota bacterium]
MTLILTPGQLKQRAELYHTLGAMLSAGLAMPKALEHVQGNPPSRSLRAPIAQWRQFLTEGASVGDAVARMGGWMPAFDAALVNAGDRSGRLDACFKLLAGYYEERSQLARKVISDLMYPAFLLHFAVVVFAFIDFLKPGHGWMRFSFLVLGILVPIYAAAGFLVFAGQGRHGEKWRGAVENILRPVPMLGAARRCLALARLAAALEALLNAGVLITSAWELAAAASGSPALGRAVRGWREAVESGATPAELVKQSPQFPEMFASLYATGEISGQLDETLGRLHRHYQEEGSRKMRLIAEWSPKLVYYIVMLVIAWHIVSFYLHLYGPGSDLDNALSGK